MILLASNECIKLGKTSSNWFLSNLLVGKK